MLITAHVKGLGKARIRSENIRSVFWFSDSSARVELHVPIRKKRALVVRGLSPIAAAKLKMVERDITAEKLARTLASALTESWTRILCGQSHALTSQLNSLIESGQGEGEQT